MLLAKKSFCPPLASALLIFALAVITGCATAPDKSPVENQATSTPHPARPFPAETLYSLLVAEFAGARNQPDIALQNYTQQAQETRDAGISRRATLIAQYLGADQLALANAELWSELDPESAEPDAVIATQLLKQGKAREAFDASIKLLNKGYQPLFQSIAAQMAKSTAPQQNELLGKFDKALETHPDNSALLLGKALLLHFLGNDTEASNYASRSLAADKSNSGAYLLKASLLEKAGARKKAANILHERLQFEPYDKRVHLQYARLISAYDLPAAQVQFKRLVEKHPFDADLLLTLAIVSKEANDKATAKEYFEQLLFIQKHQSSAYFYLGQISESEGDATRALEQYRRVSEGEEYFYAIAAFCRLSLKSGDLTQCLQHLDEERVRLPNAAARFYLMEATILQDQKQYAQSLATLNRGLKQTPDDLELLYSRSMLQEELGNLLETEKDLRSILTLDADNANALNALGYVLANKTDRLQEAHELIARALELEPENAAIVDSMGWVLYRLNRIDEALSYLRKAMTLMPNHEIAAHLGEVLWINGKHHEAREAWKKGIDDNPDSPIIKETLQRLNAK